MTKSELIEKIAAKNPSLTVKEIDRIVTVTAKENPWEVM